MPLLRLLLAASFLSCGGSVPAPREPVHQPGSTAGPTDPPRVRLAVTVDDLPFVGPTVPGDSRREAIGRILAAAEAHGAPLTGFVTCGNDRGDELAWWLRAPLTLGNHSHSHRALDDLGLGAWREDIGRCQAHLEATAGREVRFFRYPMLRTGADRELRDAGLQHLERVGLTRAPVSVDTSEWGLVDPYVEARRARDDARAEAILDEYVAHLRRATRRYVRLAATQGRAGAPQVLLLHANALAAERLDAVLTMLEAEGVDFVGLDEVLDDPLYRATDHYVGGVGLSWLYRIERDAAERWAWDAAQHHAHQVRFTGARERDAFDLDAELHVRRIADHTYVITHDSPFAANSLVAEMPDARVLLVDTPYTPEATRALLDWIEARFGAREVVAVNTHHHPDSVGGNAAILEAGGEVHASAETARRTETTAASMRASLADWLRDRPDVAARFAQYRPRPANRTFEAERGLELRFGDEVVRVIHPGHAHSPDNVVVHFPTRDLLFGGCAVLAHARLGNTADADLQAWPQALDIMEELGASIVVPGHGDRTDPGLLDHSRLLLRRMAETSSASNRE